MRRMLFALRVCILTAFPSFRHRWTQRVLETMGIHGPVWRLIEGVCQSTYALVATGAVEPLVLHMRSGIRQACPASGSIFSVAVGPELRWIMRLSPSPLNRLVVRPLGSKLAPLLRHGLLASCPSRRRRSRHWLGARPGENGAHPGIIPLLTEDLERALEELVDKTPLMAVTVVDDRFFDLGVEVGPGAHDSR